ncbi:MAG: hypothetical protein H6918_05800 [Sphingomonadaceae bacterium]|nr:hypothetical protein [Sphingomonadaceae bacterium]
MMSGATRDAIAQIASRHGILVSEGAPVTSGYVSQAQPCVITRSKRFGAGLPGLVCQVRPELRQRDQPGYGCAIGSNLAAMVADPEDLIRGKRQWRNSRHELEQGD